MGEKGHVGGKTHGQFSRAMATAFPYTPPHEEAKESADGQEALERAAVNSGNLQHAEDDHVENHGPLPAVAIAQHAEDGGTSRPQEQGKCDGGGNVGLGRAVPGGHLDGLDGKGVEVEGIGRPRRESHQEVDPVEQPQPREEPEGVSDRIRGPPIPCTARRSRW